jgi:hypothetical protein
VYRLYHFLSEGGALDAWAWLDTRAPLLVGQRLTVEEHRDVMWRVLDDMPPPSDPACPIWHVRQFV